MHSSGPFPHGWASKQRKFHLRYRKEKPVSPSGQSRPLPGMPFPTLHHSVVLGAIALGQKISGVALGGFTTVIIIQLFTGSIIMISLGIIGYYIAKIYDEVKGRPRFIIASTCGKKQSGNNGETAGEK